MQRRYVTIGFALTAVLVIWAIIAGNSDGIPDWTIAIPAVVVGFWWAFGKGVLGDGTAYERGGAPRDREP